MCYDWSKTRSTSRTNMIFSITFTKVCPIPIQNNMHWWWIEIMTHPAIYTLPFTLQLCYNHLGILQRVTKSKKAHTSSHDKLQKLYNINFPGHRSRSFLKERVEKQEFPPCPVTFLKNNQKPFLWNLRVNIPF